MGASDVNLSDQQKKMAKINKKSNFIFGKDPSLMKETTSNQTYNSKQFSSIANSNNNTSSANSLRKGNFRLGFTRENTYETTSNANFTNKNQDFIRNPHSANRSEKGSCLTHVYGNSKISYQTTSNSNFTEKDVAESFKDKKTMKERGEKLKKANFSFGHFNNSSVQNSKSVNISGQANKFQLYMMKQNQEAKQRGIELKKSNFDLSKKNDNGKSTFQSMAQIQFDEENMKGDNMAQLNKGNNEVSKGLQKDLRSSHFKFGDSKGSTQS